MPRKMEEKFRLERVKGMLELLGVWLEGREREKEGKEKEERERKRKANLQSHRQNQFGF